MRNKKNIGENKKYWRLSLFTAGMGTVLLWLVAHFIASSYLDPSDSLGWKMFSAHAAGLFAVGLCMLNKNFRYAIMGDDPLRLPSRKIFVIAVTSIIALYAVVAFYCHVNAIPLEPFMQEGIAQTGFVHWICMVTVTMLVAPVAEEVINRGVLQRILSVKDSFIWKLPAVVLITVIFVWMHPQYQYASTIVLLVCGSLLLGVARIISNGLVVPIAMHMTASGCAWLFFAVPAIIG